MDEQRLDKWLWCARFFKTRSLASDAIKAGRVAVNGQRAKPAKALAIGDVLAIKLPPYDFALTVLGIARQRLPAQEAERLYREDDASKQARLALKEKQKLAAASEERAGVRPNKKERRERAALKRDLWG